jgi:hypothetical protein
MARAGLRNRSHAAHCRLSPESLESVRVTETLFGTTGAEQELHSTVREGLSLLFDEGRASRALHSTRACQAKRGILYYRKSMERGLGKGLAMVKNATQSLMFIFYVKASVLTYCLLFRN